MKRTEPRITATLDISADDLDPKAVSEAFGLQPSRSGEKGEIWRELGAKRLCRKTGFWSLDVRRWLYSTDAVVSELLDTVWPARNNIIKYCLDHAIMPTLGCDITIHRDRPVYDFKLATLERICELRCDLLLDVFDLSDGENRGGQTRSADLGFEIRGLPDESANPHHTPIKEQCRTGDQQ